MDSQKEKFGDVSKSSDSSKLIEALTATIHELHTLNVIVEDFKSNSQPVLIEKINSYVKQLRNVNTLSNTMTCTVPLEVLDCLDNEKKNNPELVTRAQLERCKTESDTINERVHALKVLKDELQQGINSIEESSTS